MEPTKREKILELALSRMYFLQFSRRFSISLIDTGGMYVTRLVDDEEFSRVTSVEEPSIVTEPYYKSHNKAEAILKCLCSNHTTQKMIDARIITQWD